MLPQCSYHSTRVVFDRWFLALLAEHPLSADAHQTEGVCTVARPVMLWPQPDVSLLVLLFVIPAQRIDARLCRRVVEPDRWERAPAGFDASLGSALALVGNDCHVVV